MKTEIVPVLLLLIIVALLAFAFRDDDPTKQPVKTLDIYHDGEWQSYEDKTPPQPPTDLEGNMVWEGQETDTGYVEQVME